MSIKNILINTNKKSITLNTVDGNTACLSFECLRVLTPVSHNNSKQKSLVTHKKNVLVTRVENVGKHGYRLIFDDQHNAIYSDDYLTLLTSEHETRWQRYLAELKASGHSREAIIGITQL